MSRKIFISFLGTTNYVHCNYYDENDDSKKVSNIQYVQEALIKLYCSDFSKDDKLYFFLTEDAKKMNWKSNGQYNSATKEYNLPNQGLEERLTNLKLSSSIEPIDINQGFTEKEIWEIFDVITELIEPNDELILDVTHAFRSLPMLAMVLTNYLKIAKNIKVRSILYGAFEVLGPAYKVRALEPVDRNAPITDLLSFSKLQDWATAANMFIKTGRASGLKKLSGEEIKPVLAQTKGQDPFATKIRLIGNYLNEFTEAITTNRGNSIYEAKEIVLLRAELKKIQKNATIESKYKPFLSLVENAILEFEDIRKDSPDNWFYVSKWCLKNLLIQQGITIFREGIVTQILNYINSIDSQQILNYNNIDDRSFCEALMYSSQPNVNIEDYKKVVLKNLDLLNKLVEDDFFIQIAKLYNSSLDLRNDINHSGYGKLNNRKSGIFHKKLEELISKFEKLPKPEHAKKNTTQTS